MPRLTLRGLSKRRDRGAIAALVAILLASNLLLGMAALVVDVGFFYVERAELQSGADAAATAAAALCVGNTVECDDWAVNRAREYAGDNAGDGTSDVALCGRWRGLPACGPEPANRTACLGAPPGGSVPYIQARTSTRRPGGSTALPPSFSGAITGGDGVTIGACSRVSWGPALAGTVLPMAVPKCRFNAGTTNGTVFPPQPLSSSQLLAEPSDEVALDWDGPAATCVPSGLLRTGFTWLAGSSDCKIHAEVGTTAAAKTGSNAARAPFNCDDALDDAFEEHRPVLIPIYEGFTISSGVPRLNIVGLAAFVVTGFWSPSGSGGPDHSHEAEISARHLCEGLEFLNLCVYGHFTTQVVATDKTGPLGAAHYGAVFLQTIG